MNLLSGSVLEAATHVSNGRKRGKSSREFFKFALFGFNLKILLNLPGKGQIMIKFNYPDGSHCYRALHTVHAVFYDDSGKLIARAERPDRNGMYEFEL